MLKMYFQICPNSLKRFRKLELLNIGQQTSNEQEWMEVESFYMDFYSFQNSKSQYFPQPCWVYFLPFQKSKFQNFKRLIDNGGSKLSDTISCYKKIIS